MLADQTGLLSRARQVWQALRLKCLDFLDMFCQLMILYWWCLIWLLIMFIWFNLYSMFYCLMIFFNLAFFKPMKACRKSTHRRPTTGIKALKLQGTDKRVVTLREVLFGAWDSAKLSHQKLPKQLPKAGGAGVNAPISMNFGNVLVWCWRLWSYMTHAPMDREKSDISVDCCHWYEGTQATWSDVVYLPGSVYQVRIVKCYGWEAPSLQLSMERGTYKDAGFKDIDLIITNDQYIFHFFV